MCLYGREHVHVSAGVCGPEDGVRVPRDRVTVGYESSCAGVGNLSCVRPIHAFNY